MKIFRKFYFLKVGFLEFLRRHSYVWWKKQTNTLYLGLKKLGSSGSENFSFCMLKFWFVKWHWRQVCLTVPLPQPPKSQKRIFSIFEISLVLCKINITNLKYIAFLVCIFWEAVQVVERICVLESDLCSNTIYTVYSYIILTTSFNIY